MDRQRQVNREITFPGIDHRGSSPLLEFSTPDVPVSANSQFQRQPDIATGGDGTIYATWVEEFNQETWAVMFARSTDGGRTFSEPKIVDDVGMNYQPKIAVYGDDYTTTKVHIAYNYVDINIYDIYDSSGYYVGTDTTFEGDVYYCRSNNGGRVFSSPQVIANKDLDLIVMSFYYDEGGVDIDTDSTGGVHISYYSQSDEGHLMSLALWILYIIIFEAVPDFWFDYTWYTVSMRSSPDGGVNFTGQHDIIDEWFIDNVYQAMDVTGSGDSVRVHSAFTNMGIEIPLIGPISNGDVYYREVSDVYNTFTTEPKSYVDVGYVVPGGLKVGSEGNPKVGYTQIVSETNYDVYYAMSPTGGDTFSIHTPVATSGIDEYEPRLGIDLANNPFLVWSDARDWDYGVYCVWSEDGGRTLRDDQYRVDHASGDTEQHWPSISEWLPDTIRRVDVDWWDERSDSGDIYYSGAKWWRTNLNIRLNDTLAHPMEGTVTLTYDSYGQHIVREVTTGHHIIYHDPGSRLTLSQMSTGSDDTERWIYSERGGWSTTPPNPGNTYEIVYWNQYKTTFEVTKGNADTCHHTPPSIDYRYEYFGESLNSTTVSTNWADVGGHYVYNNPVPSDPRVSERWITLEPEGNVTEPVVSPTYYHQWKVLFEIPRKLNPRECSHTVPGFHLDQRMVCNVNVEGETALLAWADCGSEYIYESTHTISDVERWHIPEGMELSLIHI